MQASRTSQPTSYFSARYCLHLCSRVGIAVLLILSTATFLHAQGVAINNTGAAAAPSAQLDVSSTTKGVLIPRMTRQERLALSDPATGLLVYQTDGLQGIYCNVGLSSASYKSWLAMGSGWKTSDPVIEYNTAFGSNALGKIDESEGSANTAFGFNALPENRGGSSNTAVGLFALLSNENGSANVAVGREAMQSNSSGGNNVGIGQDALRFNTTGSNNTAVGYQANVSTGALTYATAIGADAFVSQSNSMALGGTGSADRSTISPTRASVRSSSRRRDSRHWLNPDFRLTSQRLTETKSLYGETVEDTSVLEYNRTHFKFILR